MYYAYILKSLKHGRYYTGHTDDLDERLKQHNNGETRSTKSGIPWERVFERECASRAEAMQLEKKIKKRGAKRFLDDIADQENCL